MRSGAAHAPASLAFVFPSLALVASLWAGCSGNAAVSVAVSPTTSTLTTGQTQTLSATVTGAENTAVIWSVTGGTLQGSGANTVTYTAPTAPGTYQATATSVADPTQSATVTITVSVVTVAVTPTAVTLGQGTTQQFTAMLAGTQNTAVTWTASGGTLDNASGNPVTYTAPVDAGVYSVTATSVADVSSSGTATVTVAPTFSVTSSTPGPTPFIAFVQLSAPSLGTLQSVGYVIQAMPGSASKPVNVTYAIGRLQSRGYVSGSTITLPVFGLYSGFTNSLTIQLQFDGQFNQAVPLEIATAPYADSRGVYDHPNVLVARAPGTSLGFDFFAVKSILEPVLIIDTDGVIRWVGSGVGTGSVVFDNGGFVVGSSTSAQFQRLELDGTATSSAILLPDVDGFHHNIDPGKRGVLVELDTTTNIESTLADMGPSGVVFQTWDMAALLGNYMSSNGDDAGAFVRPGVDWFHNNAATYDPSDDSVIVSSRENFVIKIDYETGAPIWILGDPTKYWYTFPSLKAKALTLADGGLYPVGQHATSLTSDGLLLLFNDGLGSLNQPPGAPTGESRSYSTVSAYSIDPATMTAREVWDFDYDRTILSSICSSAYEASGSVLVDYATADAGTTARLVGLDPDHNVVFDFEYPSPFPCGTAWNSVPIPLDNLQLQ